MVQIHACWIYLLQNMTEWEKFPREKMNWIIQYFVCNIYYLILSYIFSFTWQNFPFITWEKSKWKFKKFPWGNFTMRFSKFTFCSFGIITGLHVVWTFCSFETISGLYIEWQHLSISMLHCPAREEFPGRGFSLGVGVDIIAEKPGLGTCIGASVLMCY